MKFLEQFCAEANKKRGAICSILAASVASNQWQQVFVTTPALRFYLESNGIAPAGGEGMQFVHWITYAPSNPSVAYMGVDTDTIWKSVDGGTTWKRKGKGIKANGIVSITVDPANANRVFATALTGHSGTVRSSEGIYRTQDGGENWTLVKNVKYVYPGYGRFGGNMIAITGSVIYAGTIQDGLLKSIDGGTTWSQHMAYSVTGQVFDVKAHPTSSSTIFVSSSTGLKKVTANGAITALAAAGLTGPASPLLINPQNPQIMFAGDDTNRIMKSVNGGYNFYPSFTHSVPDKRTTWMEMSPIDPNYVFVSFGPKGWGAEAPKDFYFTQNASSTTVTWQTAQSMDEQNKYGWVASSLQNGWGWRFLG